MIFEFYVKKIILDFFEKHPFRFVYDEKINLKTIVFENYRLKKGMKLSNNSF